MELAIALRYVRWLEQEGCELWEAKLPGKETDHSGRDRWRLPIQHWSPWRTVYVGSLQMCSKECPSLEMLCEERVL